MIVNPIEFKRTGIEFLKNKRYTDAPFRSKDWWEFWEEEERRCLGGYSVGGVTIPGKYYFFLNFFPILREPSRIDKQYNRVASVQKKVLSFADFWEIQYNWHIEKEKAWNRPFGTGNHIICFKTRGSGWSYMDASEGVWNYNFVRNSKSFYLAYLEGYLLGKDGILPKCWEGLDHLNRHTDTFWLKNRHEKDTDMHKRASFFERGQKYAQGFKSEISGITIDHPRKVRGARGLKVTLEEIGSFPRFISVIEALRPLVEEGGAVLGQISAFGTGGEEGPYIEEAERIFNNPLQFNFAGFKNDYDDDGMNDTIGYFVPADIATPGFFNEDGTPRKEEAKAFWEQQYATRLNPTDRDKLMAERPLKPSHVFQRQSYSLFDKELARIQLKRIRADRAIQDIIRHGDIVPTEQGLKFVETGAKPVPFPHRNEENLDGCITIVVPPLLTNSTDVISRYIAVVDPYYKEDQPEEVISIGVCYIIDLELDMIVAWYAGRPRTKDIFHRKIFALTEYYRATMQSEIAGGGQEIVAYARSRKKLHLLEFEPEMYHNKELASNQKNRSYFMNMTTDRKRNGIVYFADWTIKQRGIKEDGSYTLNFDKIYDEWLLEEIIRYKDGKNADRISAMIVGVYMIREKVYIIENARKKRHSSNLFNRPIFVDSASSEYI